MSRTATAGGASARLCSPGAALILAGVVLVLAASAALSYQFFSLRSSLANQVAVLTALIAHQTRSALQAGDAARASETLALLREESGIVAATLVTRDGRPLASYVRGPNDPPITEYPSRPGVRFARGLVSVSQPVLAGDGLLGTLHLKSETEVIARELGRTASLGAGAIAIAALLVTSGILRMRRRHVRAGTRGSAALRRSALPERVPPPAALALGAPLVGDGHYREILEHAGDALFVHDAEGAFLDVNRRACESLGYTREELLRMQVADIELNAVTADIPKLWSAMRPGEPVTIRGLHLRRDGTTFPVDVRVSVLESDADGRRFVAIARDVTDRVQAEVRLEAAKDSAEAARCATAADLASIGHEIRTPLTAVVAMAELLSRDPDEDSRRHYVQVLHSSTRPLLSVVDSMLDLCRPDGDEPDWSDFRVRETVEDVVEMFAASAHSRGLDLVSFVEADVPMALRGDAIRLRQVLTNLLANAIKYTNHGDVSVRVSRQHTTRDGTLLRFTVCDQGIGIEPEDFARLCEPFVRGNGATSGNGSGLGLSISHSLVKKMGGSMGAERTASEGSRVWFTARFATSPLTKAPATRALDDVHVLVVHRSAAMRHYLCEQMRLIGARAASATDGQQALGALGRAAARNDPYTLCLLDYRLDLVAADPPFAERIARDERLASTRVALLVPMGLAPDAFLRARFADAVRLVTPLRPSRLDETVAALHRPKPLPRASDSPTAFPARPERTTARSVTSRVESTRVLLVEDDAVSREAIKLLLEDAGCTVHATRNGESAVWAARRDSFDAMVIDSSLPGMGGLEATEAIRLEAAHRGRCPRIVALTGDSSTERRELFISVGADAFLLKPVTTSQLARALSLQQPRERATGTHAVNPMPESARRELRAMFLASSTQQLVALKDALHENSLRLVARRAHSLRGASLLVEATELASLCEQIETCCQEANTAPLGALLTRAQEVLAGLRAEWDVSTAPPPETGVSTAEAALSDDATRSGGSG